MRRHLAELSHFAFALLISPVASTWAAAPFSFYAPANYVVHSPVFVAVADFNSDAKPDLAAADYHLNQVVVLLAGGKKITVAVGTNPIGIAIADFNLDGKPDLAVASRGANAVSIALGIGDGTFMGATSIAVGAEPVGIVTAMFNADAAPDLAVVSRGASHVSVLLGVGNGSFAAPVAYATGLNPTALASGDLNNDGHIDLTAVTSTEAWILVGTGLGTFQSTGHFGAGANLTSLAVGHFNADAALDLVTVGSSGLSASRVYVVPGNGNGTLQSPTGHYTIPNQARTITVDDFNGDAKADVASGGWNGSHGLSVLLGNGNGTLQAPLSYPVGNVYAIATFDFNADGKRDVAWADASGAVVSIRLGKGNGTFQAEPRIPLVRGATAGSIVTGDFNNDGHADIGVGFLTIDAVAVILGNGDGSFAPPRYINPGASVGPLIAGDFNNDGNLDLVGDYNEPASGTAFIMRGNGDGTFQPAQAFSLFTEARTAHDFNLDGNLDLALGGSGPHGVFVALGKGDGTFDPAYQVGPGAAESLKASDFNNDGFPDLVIGRDSPHVTILLANGDGTFTSMGDFATGREGYSSDLAIADLNKDGKLDVAVGGGDFQITVLLGNGDGKLGNGALIPSGGISPWLLEAVDVNDDTHVDLIPTNLGSNAFSVLAGNSTGAFTPEWACAATHDCAVVNFGVGGFPRDMAVADFNDDLKPDVATVNDYSSSISIVINTSP